MRSIERHLLAWLLGALAFGTALITLAAYLVTLDEMNEIFDADLKNVVGAVAIYRAPEALARRARTPAVEGDPADIVTRVWTPDGRLVFTSDARAALPFTATPGLSSQRIGDEEWIVYTGVEPQAIVQAAQRVEARHEVAAESASKILPPLLALMLVIAALTVFALRRGLEPLDATARDVASRSARSLAPIAPATVPREIEPLLVAINGLMSRLSLALASQRAFLADAAHELRTPVTALRLQLQLLERAGNAAARQAAAGELRQGVERLQHLVEQLLQVARAEPDAAAAESVDVDLGALVRSAVAAFSARAGQLQLDLGAHMASGLTVRGDPHQLAVLLDNLIENALRYTPAGGVVDVEACRLHGRPALRVIDDGPGIAPEERERVFERFGRGADAPALARDGAGSGLGLAIVRAIAERHAARVTLHTPPSGRGLEVRVVFAENGQTPKAPCASTPRS